MLALNSCCCIRNALVDEFRANGICLHQAVIAIDIRQLPLLTGKSQSSINGFIQLTGITQRAGRPANLEADFPYNQANSFMHFCGLTRRNRMIL
jgi:hypothetical protein